MKILIAALFILTFSSCASNVHDGYYDDSYHGELIKLNGSDLYVIGYNLNSHKVKYELKTSCHQFPDRIEFTNKDGVTVVARVEGNTITCKDYEYEKVSEHPLITY